MAGVGVGALTDGGAAGRSGVLSWFSMAERARFWKGFCGLISSVVING